MSTIYHNATLHTSASHHSHHTISITIPRPDVGMGYHPFEAFPSLSALHHSPAWPPEGMMWSHTYSVCHVTGPQWRYRPVRLDTWSSSQPHIGRRPDSVSVLMGWRHQKSPTGKINKVGNPRLAARFPSLFQYPGRMQPVIARASYPSTTRA
jgi:hypothetical protein